MRKPHVSTSLCQISVLSMVCAVALCAQSPVPNLTETGKIVVDGQPASYTIHRLPVSSFPSLPSEIANILNLRGCMIPQTYEAHRPENVVHASLKRAGSSDWAVLCSAEGDVSLLVFLEGQFDHPAELASAHVNRCLQAHDPSGVLGFNWGIDRATPKQVHDAQAGLDHGSPLADHDALADSILERRTVFHFYANGSWTLLDTPD